MKLLVTGAAGFIGYSAAQRFLARGDRVVGIDNLNDYYDVSLKQARLARLAAMPGFHFERIDFADRTALAALFARERFELVVHLGAQAGVRHSLKDPHRYIESNVVGSLNVLEGARHNGVAHLVYASTSSVYGANTRMPYSVHDPVSHPLSLYAASKLATELMAHNYSTVFGLPTTGLRFFTVYGPWGRPDMALSLFTRAMLEGRPIEVFNHGLSRRDFTYIDDVVEAVLRVSGRIAQPNPAWRGDQPDPASSRAPYRLYNIGSHRPVELLRYIEVLEDTLGLKAKKLMQPAQPGDMPETCADMSDFVRDFGYQPQTSIEAGVGRFVDWYREYYGFR